VRHIKKNRRGYQKREARKSMGVSETEANRKSGRVRRQKRRRNGSLKISRNRNGDGKGNEPRGRKQENPMKGGRRGELEREG